MLTFISGFRRYLYNSGWLYNARIFIALAGAALLPWWMGQPTTTIPLTLGVVAAALTDLDDRLTGRLRNLFITLLALLNKHILCCIPSETADLSNVKSFS